MLEPIDPQILPGGFRQSQIDWKKTPGVDRWGCAIPPGWKRESSGWLGRRMDEADEINLDKARNVSTVTMEGEAHGLGRVGGFVSAQSSWAAVLYDGLRTTYGPPMPPPLSSVEFILKMREEQ